MVVSHDRHLLRLVSDSLWLVTGGCATPFGGDIDDYVRWLAQRHAARTPGEPRIGGSDTAAHRRDRRRWSAQQRRQVEPLRREIEVLERRLHALSDERTSIESVLAGGDIYGEDERRRLNVLLVRRGKLDAEITSVESAWLEKSEQLDAMRESGRESGTGASRGMQ